MTTSAVERTLAGPISCPPTPSAFRLEEQDVHVWCASLDDLHEDRARLEAVLSADERERARRFHFAEDRNRFAVSRGVLRELLGRYLQQAAPAIAFSIGRFGKPEIAKRLGQPRLSFSLSRSGALALYAVTPKSPIGVDVERVREIPNFDVIASRYFSRLEASRLMTAPPHLRHEELVACWTRKEALLKATGEGVGGGLGTRPASDRPDWRLHPLRPAPGYVGAVACRHATARLSFRSVSKELLCRSQS